ncbi:MAG: phage major capsid protein [Gammaproteobacteria bacterium]|nr:phage major capsid protein [Gammaproteobacteria bacterium]
MKKTIRLPSYKRTEVEDIDSEQKDSVTRLYFSATSEVAVQRSFGREILSHAPGAVNLERAETGALPLLWDHSDIIGMVDGVEIKDGRSWVEAHLFDTERAREVGKMVAGGLRNVSAQYVLDEVEETEPGTFVARKWTPIEYSIVRMPADHRVGIGRSHDEELFDVQFRTLENNAALAAKNGEATPANTRKAKMENQNAPVVSGGDNSAAELEASRVRAIKNLASANNISEDVQARWITGGTSVEAVSSDLMQILKARSENAKSVTEIGLSDVEARRYSLGRAIKAAAEGNWSEAGFEAECSREIAKRTGKMADGRRIFVPNEVQHRGARAMSASSFANGGALVQTTNGGMSFIDMLRNSSVVYRAGAFRLPGLVGNVTIPKQLTAASVSWVGEGASGSASNMTLGQVSLAPKTAIAVTEISRQLLLQSTPAVDALVTNDLSQAVGLAVDLAALKGSGNAGQPLGIISTSGIGSVSGTSIAYAGIVEFQTDCAGSNALSDAAAYVTTPAVAGLLKARVKFSNTASPIWEGKLLNGSVDGYAAHASNQMPSANLLFGDFGQLVVGEWGVLEIEVDPHYGFATGQIGVRALYSVDVAVRHAAAFSLATSVT